MSYLVLARKYRPQNFSQVYAQEHITSILQNSIQMDRIAHAYLFTGTRGVGKTSMARIFAKSLNCLTNGPTITPCETCENCISITQGNSADVIEIDGASNTGVDDIRDLQRELMYVTSNALYKIYIIDEVHMLSKSAFNALLKTLEEPPKNVIFIFATTEPHKVLPTIISRCQRFDCKRIPIPAIISQLQVICEKEKIEIEEEALYLVAKKADGSMRDALSLMDQVFAYGSSHIKLDEVLSIFGVIHYDVYNDLVRFIAEKDTKQMISSLHKVLETGSDLQEFLNGFLDYLRYLMLLKLGIEVQEITEAQQNIMIKIVSSFSENDILYIMSLLIQTKTDIKNSVNPLLVAEMSMIRLTKLAEMQSVQTLLETIKKQPASMLDNPAMHLKRAERKLHINATKEIKNVVKSIEKEQPKIDKLSTQIVTDNFDFIIEKVKQSKPIISNYLNLCTISQVSDFRILFASESTIQVTRLKSEKDFLTELISNHFGIKIKIDFELDTKNSKQPLRNPTLEDIQKESPKLAEFIRIIDATAEIKSDSMY
jgi:DNA polymerase III subunit gamma/tau